MRYRIRTVAGGGFAVPIGGSVTTFEIEDIAGHQSRYYTLFGVEFGFGVRAGTAGPSSWTEFAANCGLEDFHGYVTLTHASAVAGVGVGGISMYFAGGPASGVRINGIGWSTGVDLSAGATHGWMRPPLMLVP